jgi:DNA-binding NarL/FixJ family response regulator
MVGGGISVLAVDDHPVFADALQARLSSEPDLRPVDVAYNSADALLRVSRGRVDVAVLDYMLGDTTGVALTESIRGMSPRTEIVMLSAVDSIDAVVDAVAAGVRAWLPKTVDTAHLVRVVRGVHAGEMWLDPALLGRVIPQLRERVLSPDPDPFAVLTRREREVLDSMVDGHSRAEIADLLQLSTNTVRTHTQNLMAKLGAHSSLEVVTMALRFKHRQPPT